MEFELIFADTQARSASVDEDSLHAALEAFLGNFLSQNSAYRETFVQLRLKTELTSFENEVARVSCNGQAVFSEAVDDLTKMILTYFSFWGVQDLQEYLYEAGYLVKDVVVVINGEEVQVQASPDDQANAATETKTQAPPSDNRQIIVIAVVATIAALLIAGSLWIVFKRRSRTDEALNKHMEMSSHGSGGTNESFSPRHSNGEAQHELRIIGSVSAGSTPAASPNRSGALSPTFSGDDIRSYSGVLSVEDSLFTTTNDGEFPVKQHSPRAFQYDPSRLDHVISSAKGLTQLKIPDAEETITL
jgi:hypothetical protein